MKKIINFYKRLSFFQGAAFAVTLTSLIGFAATVGPITTFTPGTVISSSQINTNFANLKTAVESIGASQVFMGTYDIPTNGYVDPTGATVAGEYYIVTVPGATGSGTYAIGDWMMFNGSTYDKVPGTSTTVFGRTGAVIATEGDYDLLKLSDVTITSPTNGQVLTYNGSQWINSPISYTEVDPSVLAFAKTALPTCSAGEVLKSNGSMFSCVTTGFTGSPSKAVITDAAGNLVTSTTTSAELNYISGLSSSVQSQLNTKLDLTGGTLSVGTISGIPAPVSGSDAANKNYVDSTQAWQRNGSDISFSTGNVGIGISNPTSDFQVAGNAAISGKIIIADGTAAQPSIANGGGENNGLFFPITGEMGFTTSGSEKVRIATNGNVGIGITTPAEKLSVGGNIISDKYKLNGAGSSSTPQIFAMSATTGLFFPNTTDLGFASGGVEKIRFAGGNVGIGTIAPAAALDVVSTTTSSAIIVPRATTATRPGTPADGMIRYNTTTLLMEFYQNGSWVNFTTISDGRLKTNVNPIHRGLATVNKLQPVFFDWDQNSARAKSFGSKHQVGFIAQQVEKVLPEVVNIGRDSFRSIEYGKMVAVVVSAIQELSMKFDSMESRNNNKEREFEIVKEENRMMKNYLCTRDPMAPFCEQ